MLTGGEEVETEIADNSEEFCGGKGWRNYILTGSREGKLGDQKADFCEDGKGARKEDNG